MADIKRPDGASVIKIDWLNNLEVWVINKAEDFIFFIDEHGLRDKPLANDWEVAEGSMAILENNGIKCFILIFPTNKQRVIVHECVHMAQAIMEHKGIELCNETSEVLAYMTDYLFSQVNKVLN